MSIKVNETYLPPRSSAGFRLAKTENLTAAAITCHNAFPVFCERFSFFPGRFLELAIPALWLESDPKGGGGRSSFRMGKLVVRNSSYKVGVVFGSSSIRPKIERKKERTVRYDI